MNRNASFYLKTGLLGLFILIIFAYSFIQTKNLIFGPVIHLSSPINGQTYTNPLIDIKGSAKNANYLEMDDRSIFTDEKGHFEDKMLLSPGYNIIKFKAQDKFGNKVEKMIEVILKEPKTDDTMPTASSTANQ